MAVHTRSLDRRRPLSQGGPRRRHTLLCALDVHDALRDEAGRLATEASDSLVAQGAAEGDLAIFATVHLRFAGTEAALPIHLVAHAEMVDGFTCERRARFGFAGHERALVADTVAVKAIAASQAVREAELPARPRR